MSDIFNQLGLGNAFGSIFGQEGVPAPSPLDDYLPPLYGLLQQCGQAREFAQNMEMLQQRAAGYMAQDVPMTSMSFGVVPEPDEMQSLFDLDDESREAA